MITIIGKSELRFGITEDKPDLPEGWEYIEAPDDWLQVRDDLGNIYFIEVTDESLSFSPKATATWFDQMRTFGKLKAGTVFMDTRRKITIARS